MEKKEEWRYALEDSGELSVTMSGITMMPWLFVDNLGLIEKVLYKNTPKHI